MGFGFGPAETYTVDLPLFTKLGLKPFAIDNQEKTFVGEVKNDEGESGTVKIWVTCLPAQFWYFDIVTSEGTNYEIQTGSGSLSDYWKAVNDLAAGMMVLNKKQTT